LIGLFGTVVRDVNEQLSRDAYAKLEDVQKAIDLTPFLKKVDSQEKFTAGFFKYATAKLIELAYYEAKNDNPLQRKKHEFVREETLGNNTRHAGRTRRLAVAFD